MRGGVAGYFGLFKFIEVKPRKGKKMRSEPEAHYGLYLEQLEKNRTEEMEKGLVGMIDFKKLKKIAQLDADLIPVVVQDAESKEVLILAYANRKAVKRSLLNGTATFWSTSRRRLWIKGKESGNSLELIEVRVNCEQNSLLYLVRKAKGGACHVKDRNDNPRNSCFYRRILGAGGTTLQFVEE